MKKKLNELEAAKICYYLVNTYQGSAERIEIARQRLRIEIEKSQNKFTHLNFPDLS